MGSEFTMENRKKKKWDLGKALEEGVQQLSKDVKEAFKEIKTTTQTALNSRKTQKTPASGATAEAAYFQEKKLTASPKLKCEFCQLDFTEELINSYLRGNDVICERCGQPYGGISEQ